MSLLFRVLLEMVRTMFGSDLAVPPTPTETFIVLFLMAAILAGCASSFYRLYYWTIGRRKQQKIENDLDMYKATDRARDVIYRARDTLEK